jgi:hypothetical protein
MRRFTLLLVALFVGAVVRAQTTATFEVLPLAHADTFYTNYTASGTDVGFNNGLAHFPCVYDTSWGGVWSSGFAYSNMTDTITSGFTNQYSAKAGKGYAGSEKYVVAYGSRNQVKLMGAAMGHPVKGCYITNNTYAFNSMRDGDMFARKFRNGDWFRITARGYYNGVMKPDSTYIYLANYLFPDTTNNYIQRNWIWWDLEPLGKVDSIEFQLASTDVGAWGMNTPAYFCMDDFTTYETFDTTTPPVMVPTTTAGNIRVYPIPASNTLNVDLPDDAAITMTISDMSGRVVARIDRASQHTSIDTAPLATGMYVLHIAGDGRKATMKFTKQ